MKKMFPDAPDVPQSVANRASKIVEKHLRLHRVERARDLPEEAKVRLYRDLRFLFDSGGQPPSQGNEGFSISRFFAGMWEKIEDFFSMSESCRVGGIVTVFAWASFGDSARLAIDGWSSNSLACIEQN